MKRMVFTLMAVLAFALWYGCEGEQGPVGPAGSQGPPGPSTILAFADIDGEQSPPLVRSFGPSSTVTSIQCVYNGVGFYSISVFGTFPGTPGTLVVSPASTEPGQLPGVTTNIVGNVTTWTNALVVFDVGITYTDTGVARDDDFSFVLFGE